MKANQDKYRNESLGALFNNSLDAIVSIDANYCVVDINQAFIDLFGYNLEEIKGKHVDEVMNMSKQDSANTKITAAVLAGEQIEEEGIRYKKDGSPIDVLIQGIPIMNEGKMVGAYGIYADITERKQTEMVLRESEARNQAILSTIPDLMFIFDREGTYLDFHATDKSLLAVKPEEFLGKSICEILPEDLSAQFMQCFDQIHQTKQTQVIEYILDVPGGLKHFEARITIMDEQRMLAIIRDITESKQAAEEVRIQQKRLENVIEGANIGIWEWTRQSGETIYNETWANLLGYTLDELQPVSVKTWEMLTHPDDRHRSDELAERHISGELPYYECEVRMKHKDGHWVWVLDRGKILTRSADGRPLSMFGTHIDITERKLAEEQIRYISLHDNLTGLYNRTYLEEEMKRLDTTRQLPFSIVMLDLNSLKLINDTYGHQAGDRALQYAADILRNSCREEDIVARWGGDEFIILLPQTSVEDASLLCKRIIDGCRDVYAEDVPVSMALGVASKTEVAMKLTEILREAENNMYKQKLTESHSTKDAVLKALLKTLKAKSYETEAHTRGMQEMAQKIGQQLGLPNTELNRLDLLITLHDIGYINISEEILTKNGTLTEEEYEIIKKHPEIGFRVARATGEFAHVAEDILAHHERWDGTGYPQGLKGKNIPLLARITAIADAFEVMTNGRPYKKALSSSEIIAEFKRCAGTQFDPQLIEIFLSLNNSN